MDDDPPCGYWQIWLVGIAELGRVLCLIACKFAHHRRRWFLWVTADAVYTVISVHGLQSWHVRLAEICATERSRVRTGYRSKPLSAFASGVARNSRQGVHQSVAFLPIHPCRSAAMPRRPYNQEALWYEPPVWTAAPHWVPTSVNKWWWCARIRLNDYNKVST